MDAARQWSCGRTNRFELFISGLMTTVNAPNGRTIPILVHLTTVHCREDVRIYQKEVRSLARHFDANLVLIVADGNGDVVDEGIQIIDLGSRFSSRTSRVLRGSLLAFRRIRLFALRPSIIHFHDPELIPLGIVLSLFGYRVIYDVHEDLPRDILSKAWIPSPARPLIGKLAALMEHFAAVIFNGILAATPTIARRFPSGKTALVQNFPMVSELHIPSADAYDSRGPRFIYVGGVAEIRGAKEMVNAIAQLDYPDARLQIAGVFQPPELELDLAKMLGWQKIEYVGWKDRNSVAKLLASSRAGLVLLHPLINYVDALPVKMFEYMATGLPVIASDFPLWRKIIDSSDCGLLVDPFDIEAVAAAMGWILENAADAEQMGRRGRQAVEQIYNWDIEAKALFGLYVEILPDLAFRYRCNGYA